MGKNTETIASIALSNPAGPLISLDYTAVKLKQLKTVKKAMAILGSMVVFLSYSN